MGRKRLDENEKKIVVNVSMKKKYVDLLKEKHKNISEIIEKLVKNYLMR